MRARETTNHAGGVTEPHASDAWNLSPDNALKVRDRSRNVATALVG
jgi:hypothetical protein